MSQSRACTRWLPSPGLISHPPSFALQRSKASQAGRSLSLLSFTSTPTPFPLCVSLPTVRKSQNPGQVLCLVNSAAPGACRILQGSFSAQEAGEICNHTYPWRLCVWFSHLVIKKFLPSNPCSSKCVYKGAVLANLGACWRCPVSNSTPDLPNQNWCFHKISGNSYVP